jgi:OmpA-OmpF porin, OOP family
LTRYQLLGSFDSPVTAARQSLPDEPLRDRRRVDASLITTLEEVVVRATKAVVALAVLSAVLVPAGLESQTVLERAKQRARDRVERRTDAAIEKTLDAAENATVCVVTDAACVEAAQAKGQDVTLTDADGRPLPAGEQPAPPRVGEGAWANYDFVPGERVVFFEDFTRDRVGNFPQRLELVTGNAEVVEWSGRRWLRMNDNTVFKVPLPETLPERFTVEFELPVPWHGMGMSSEPSSSKSTYVGSHQLSAVLVSGTEAGVLRNAGSPGKSTVDPRQLFGDAMFPTGGSLSNRIYRVSLQVDGKYIKLYLDERRVANLPNGEFGRQDYLVFEFYSGSGIGPLITGISVNAGGQSMYDALMADGRVSTQGILFATGSAVIRPQSTPTLKEIGEMLRTYPQLRLAIEGHTDNVGQDAANQKLSEGRAAAVRDHLIATYGINAGRLEAQGFGASRPTTSNDTAEGRQANRRVDLVRL